MIKQPKLDPSTEEYLVELQESMILIGATYKGSTPVSIQEHGNPLYRFKLRFNSIIDECTEVNNLLSNY